MSLNPFHVPRTYFGVAWSQLMVFDILNVALEIEKRCQLSCMYMLLICRSHFALKYSRVHTTKLAQARPRPGLGSAQVYVVSTLQGQIANVDTNLGRAHDSTQVIARNVRNKDDYLLVKKY